MDTKLFKAFTPFIDRSNLKRYGVGDFALLGEHETSDPSGGQWRTMGFAEFSDGEYAMNIQDAGWLVAVHLNERNLPGAVVREKMVERIAELTRQTGRKPGKKEYAQIKDDCIISLLPMAFIRRKVIPVMFVKNKIFVFTSSAKTCDDVMTLLVVAMNSDTFRPDRLEHIVENNIDGSITELARDGVTTHDDDVDALQTNNVATLKGEKKQTINIKDKDISSYDITELLKQDYTVTKLGLDFLMAGETDVAASFILNDKLVFSRFILPDVKNTGERGDDEVGAFLTTAWITAKTASSAVDCVVEYLGGLQPVAKPAEPSGKATKAVAEDEDDL